MREPTELQTDPDHYAPPLVPLLTLGELDAVGTVRPAWPDYPTRFDLTAEHVPALIEIAMADTTHVDYPHYWAPVHAWRAIGQLGAVEAVEPLTALLANADEDYDDYLLEEVPIVLGMLGDEMVPLALELLDDRSRGDWVRGAAAQALRHRAVRSPALRDEVVAALVTRLGRFAEEEPAYNSMLVGELIDLRAVEAAPLIEQAFAADAVDISMNGDWEDVQIALGLLATRRTPRPHYHAAYLRRSADGTDQAPPAVAAATRAKARSKAERKRKMAKRSRRQNRKRR